jgi:transposase
MARPYSLDLRERVVALVARGETCRSVAAVFDVSVASVVKWSQRSRATGSAAAKAMGGKWPYLLEGERSFLLSRLAERRSDPRSTRRTVLSQNAWLPVLRTLGTTPWHGGRLLVSRAGSVFDEAGRLGPIPHRDACR